MKSITIIYLVFFSIFCSATSTLRLNTQPPSQINDIELNIAHEDLADLISEIANDSVMILQNFGIELNDTNNQDGLVIKHILKNSSAAQAQLHPSYLEPQYKLHVGDIIIKVNQQSVTNSNQLKQMQPTLKIGAPLMLTVIRNKHKIKVNLKTLNIA